MKPIYFFDHVLLCYRQLFLASHDFIGRKTDGGAGPFVLMLPKCTAGNSCTALSWGAPSWGAFISYSNTKKPSDHKDFGKCNLLKEIPFPT